MVYAYESRCAGRLKVYFRFKTREDRAEWIAEDFGSRQELSSQDWRLRKVIRYSGWAPIYNLSGQCGEYAGRMTDEHGELVPMAEHEGFPI